MELNELIFLGACQLLAPEIREHGFGIALEKWLDTAIKAAKKVWLRTLENENQ